MACKGAPWSVVPIAIPSDLTMTRPPASLLPRGLRQRGFAALSYLNAQPAALVSPTNAWSTARLDAYYGLARPFTAGDWLTWKPVVGVRATDWSSALNGLGNVRLHHAALGASPGTGLLRVADATGRALGGRSSLVGTIDAAIAKEPPVAHSKSQQKRLETQTGMPVAIVKEQPK